MRRQPLINQLTLLLLVLLLFLILVFSLFQGPANIPFSSIVALLAEPLGVENTQADIRPWMHSVLTDVRMPRLLVGALAGASLAVCGAVMQGMFRNPLASPSILGVSSGASLGAVIALYLGLASISIWALPVFASLGAALTLFIVYRVASQRGHIAIGMLLLSGIAIGALNSAASTLILALSLNNWEVGRLIVYWTMGGLEARTWSHVLLLLPTAVISISGLLFFARTLDALLLGEVHAASIGVDVAKARRQLLIITSLLVGVTISVCGGIGFIGLVVPHILRMLLGPQHRYLLPACALGGAICLVGADLLLRTLLAEKAVPLGVITAMLGAPFFLFLLIKQRVSAEL